MEEVIKILGSWNVWLPYANIAAIIVLVAGYRDLAEKTRSIEHDIDYLDRGVERLSGVTAKLMRGGKRKQ
tara:strand:+ start:169 stop:378 length:210 start_codon:yes stop_codon:yes gene_type:complete